MSPCLLVSLSTALFFHRLADRGLWSSHEARAAMDAQTLREGGGALPRLFDGTAEVQKPPLYYWLVAAAARLRGGAVDAWAVRLPAAGAALLAVLALAAGLAAIGRPRAGLLAGLVLATAVHFTWLARVGRIDMPLTLSVTAAAGCFYLALRRARPEGPRLNERCLLLGGYVAVAAGVLLKGPIGLALPAAVVAGHLLMEGRWPAFWELRAWRRLAGRQGLWWGAPLVLALTLPVFAWLDGASGGRFSSEFFWHHNVQRGLGGSRLRGHPWWLYAPLFLLYFLPWSPLVLWAGWRRGAWRADPEARFGLAWLLAVLVLLSCARFKRADYLLPAYPGAAIFLGGVLSRRARSPAALAGVAGVVGVLVLGWGLRLEGALPVAEPGGSFSVFGRPVRSDWVLPAPEAYRDYTAFAAAVRARTGDEVVFFRAEAHALAFHVGRPLSTLVGWRELQARLDRPGAHLVVMPPGAAAEWRHHLRGVRLEEVLRNTDLSGGRHERPLVLLRGTKDDVQRTR